MNHTKSIPIRDGDVISSINERELKLGIYVGNGSVVYAKTLHFGSPVKKIMCESLEKFCENYGVSTENYYMTKSKYIAISRVERALQFIGKFWGNKHDTNPSESFIRFVCEDISPPDGSVTYKFTFSGAALGLYLGGVIGATIGSTVGYIIDRTK
jgi:hypothetical protein